MNSIKMFLLVLSGLICTFAAPVDSITTRSIGITIDTSVVRIPYYRNYSLGTTRDFITRAVIMVHGTNRNADDYYQTAYDAVGQAAGQRDSILVIAPQFLSEEDIIAYQPGDDYAFWSDGGWKSGSLSLSTTADPRPVRISSYTVMDTILSRIVAHNPRLRIIVVAGHSAGGQFVNRYAAASPVITRLCADFHVPIRCIVANPSSYVYLDSTRRVPGTLDRFAIPADGCAGYNDYKYGLDNLYSYLRAVGVPQIRQQYGQREVVYLLGGDDTDPASSTLDVSCEAMLQGNHRLERGTIYHNYLRAYYGDGVTARHTKVIVPGVGHDNYAMFNSAAGVNAIMANDTLSLCTDVGVVNREPDGLPARHYFSTRGAGCGRLFNQTGRSVPADLAEPGIHFRVTADGRVVKVLVRP